MKILFCTDGSIQAENAIRFGAVVALACRAEATVLGIADAEGEQSVLAQALARGQQLLADKAQRIELISRIGEPVEQIVQQTAESNYDLVVIGAVRKDTSGSLLMSAKAYKIIRSIAPPVLTVIGSRTKLQNILVCSGGRDYIDKALELTGRIARGVGAKVTLMHVMAEPPRMYAGLIAREENVEGVLNSSSLLGLNLKRQKAALESMGVATEVRLGHGEVMPELLREIRRLDYDLIVAGSSPARGRLQSYIMGDITRELVNRAECPVLVVRTGDAGRLPVGFTRLLTGIKEVFGRR